MRAVAAPRPDAPPVTRNVVPRSSIVMTLQLGSCARNCLHHRQRGRNQSRDVGDIGGQDHRVRSLGKIADLRAVFLGDFLFSRYRLMLLAVVAAILLGVWLLLQKTSFGRVVRAGIQRPDMVAALGIRLQPYMTVIVALGVAMAAIAGALFAPITIVHPAMGAEIITVAFVVVVIGGLGSFWGVVLAALLVGVVRGITIHFAPAAGEASIYILMFFVLLFRPRCLLGERIEKFE
jgi:branched-subunit amino acid ABC-type transport system permease component